MTNLNNRHTRVQLIIVEEGKYILLKHLVVNENRTFWGLPGGGVETGESEEEAAVREAKEETGLDVHLTPIKFELELAEKRILYHRIVTFLAYPIGGEAKTGHEPEAEEIASYNYRLLDLKWHDFYDDGDVDDLVLESMIPIRDRLVKSGVIRKAGALVVRKQGDEDQALLISARRNPDVLILPQGHIDPGESPDEAAIRETREESGFIIEIETDLGFMLYQGNDDLYQTFMFVANVIRKTDADENRDLYWMSAGDIEDANIPIQSKRLVKSVLKRLRD